MKNPNAMPVNTLEEIKEKYRAGGYYRIYTVVGDKLIDGISVVQLYDDLTAIGPDIAEFLEWKRQEDRKTCREPR